MSWLNLNDSLNNIKGQLSSFASGVLTDSDVSVSQEEVLELKTKLQDLQKLCSEKDSEIEQLRLLTSQNLHQTKNETNHTGDEVDGWDWNYLENPINGDSESITFKYKDDISKLRNKIDNLETEKEELEKSLEQLDSDHQETINKLITLKDSIQRDYNTLKDDYADLKNEFGELMKENLEKTKKIQELLDYKDLEKENESLKSNLEQFKKNEEEYKLLKSVYEEQNEIKASLIIENHKLKEENQTLLQKISDLNSSMEQLKRQNEYFISNESTVKESPTGNEKHINQTEFNNNKNGYQNEVRETQYLNIFNENLRKYLLDDILNEDGEFMETIIDNDPELDFSQKIEQILKILLKYKTKFQDLEKDVFKVTEDKNKIIQEKNFEIEKLLQNSEILSQEVLNKTQTITDYEKECAQLMENNDLLIAELQSYKNNSGLQTISESNEDNMVLLESQLENSNKKIQELEAIITDLENRKQENSIEAETELLYVKKHLNLTGQELNDTKEKYQELQLRNEEIEKESSKWQGEYMKLKQVHDLCDEEKLKLKATIEKLTADYENLEYSLTENNVSSESLTEENETYKKQIEENATKLAEYEKLIKEYSEEINEYKHKIQHLENHNKNLEVMNFSMESNLIQLQSEIESLKKEMHEKIENDERNQNQIRILTEKLQNSKMSETGLKLQFDTLYKELLNTKEAKQRLEKEVDELKKIIAELNELEKQLKKEKQLTDEQLQNYNELKEEYDHLILKNRELEELLANKENHQKQVLELEDVPIHDDIYAEKSRESVQNQQQISQLKKELEKMNISHSELLQKQSALETQNLELNKARNELIDFIQAKHQENIQYHNEIRRLNQIVTLEFEKRQSLEAEIANLKEKLNEYEKNLSTNTETDNEELAKLKERITYLEEEKMHFANEITKLNEEVRSKNEELLQNQDQMKKLVDKNKSLCEKCEALAENLLQEQANLQKILSEYTSPSEREQSLLKELDRLRAHLVEMEEGYTQELLQAEQRNQEMLAKVNEIEQREKQSSSVYTSINIRANQQVETMQVQLQLVTNQRDELRKKLSDAEDQINKQNAAVTNLQLVLEQFQKEKEKDIYIETERIRRQIKAEKLVQEELRQEVANLKSQLEASKQGLQAASRLNDQLENCKQQIATYKDKVRELQEKLTQAEEKCKELSTNTDAKVDKNLIKNLVIGFVTSSHNSNMTTDQHQILKIIATVLDFNQQESEKVRLNKVQPEGWLNSLLHPQLMSKNHNESKESLSEAFIRFLETESKPKVIPNLLPHMGVNKPSEANSTNSSKRQSPLLLSEIVLPTFADFGQSRSSSSILKDVLKDNS